VSDPHVNQYIVPANVALITESFAGGVAPPTVIQTSQVVVGAAATLLVAADPLRRGLVIKNDAAAGTHVWIGDATVTAATGFDLDGGESITLTGTEAVFGIRTGAATVTIAEELLV
jgi:hypothetical protein